MGEWRQLIKKIYTQKLKLLDRGVEILLSTMKKRKKLKTDSILK